MRGIKGKIRGSRMSLVVGWAGVGERGREEGRERVLINVKDEEAVCGWRDEG